VVVQVLVKSMVKYLQGKELAAGELRGTVMYVRLMQRTFSGGKFIQRPRSERTSLKVASLSISMGIYGIVGILLER